jgi:AraC-like DNA-binding protein
MNRPATAARIWDGILTLTPTGAIFAGTGGDTPAHRHLAHKIVVGARAVGPSEALRGGGAPVAVPAGMSHRVLAADRRVILVYLDARWVGWPEAERLAARWARLSPGGAVDGPSHRPGAALRGPAEPGLVDALIEDVAALSTRTTDRRALAAIDAMARGESLAEVGGRLGLSESRVTHLVTEQLGAPPRAWRTWIRLRRAVDQLGHGETVTHVAHAAGFADAAHFSRTCSAALGIAPSALQRIRIEPVTALGPICGDLARS